VKKVVCAACGLVNLQTFPSFPMCEGCGARLASPRRLGLRSKLKWKRPIFPLVWAIVLGAGVAVLALFSVGLTREANDRDRGRLSIQSQSAPDARDPRVTIWTLVLRPLNTSDEDPLRGVRLRVGWEDEKRWRFSIVSPRPATTQSLGSGHYFSWSVLPRGAAVRVRFTAPTASSGASSLRLLWGAEEFEGLPLVLRVAGAPWKRTAKSFTLRP